MECNLCNALNEEWRLLKKTKKCFCIIAKWPLKEGHIIILPIRHVENYSGLSEEEAKEMFELVDEMDDVIKSKCGEDAIIYINKGKHGSERHIHLHIVPSKGNLRQLMSKYENIPEKKDIPEKEMNKMRDKIISWKN